MMAGGVRRSCACARSRPTISTAPRRSTTTLPGAADGGEDGDPEAGPAPACARAVAVLPSPTARAAAPALPIKRSRRPTPADAAVLLFAMCASLEGEPIVTLGLALLCMCVKPDFEGRALPSDGQHR